MKPPKYMYIVHVHPYKSMYICWIYRKAEGEPLYYQDLTIKEMITFENKIVYMCIGFSEESVLNKARKYIQKVKEKENG